MHLQGEIAAAHRIQKIKAYRKLSAEARMDRVTQQLPRMAEQKIDRRDFNPHIAEAQEQAIFFRHTIEAPCVIRFVFGNGKAAYLFHPVAAPWARVKIRHNSKGTSHGFHQTAAQEASGNQFWNIALVGIE